MAAYPSESYHTQSYNQTIFLTGVTNPAVEDVLLAHPHAGLLVQPDSYGSSAVARWKHWAADNGCYAKGDDFDPKAWLSWLEALAPEHRSRCLFATAPDVVGDAVETLLRSLPYLAKVRAMGYPAAFVAQDGSEKDPDNLVPWDDVDVLFLGGTTEWKLDHYKGGRLAFEALRRGRRVHMGRVNSKKRLDIADLFGCATADGTFLAFGPTKNLPALIRWWDFQPQHFAKGAA